MRAECKGVRKMLNPIVVDSFKKILSTSGIPAVTSIASLCFALHKEAGTSALRDLADKASASGDVTAAQSFNREAQNGEVQVQQLKDLSFATGFGAGVGVAALTLAGLIFARRNDLAQPNQNTPSS